MKTKHIFIPLGFLLFIACNYIPENKPIQIYPDKFMESEGSGILPLFKCTENFILLQNYISAQIDTFNIRYPVFHSVIDTAYTTMSFPGDSMRALNQLMLIVFTNYSTDSIRLFCDLNNNLDLSDDGKPFLLDRISENVHIPLTAPGFPKAVHYAVLHFPEITSPKSIEAYENIFARYAPYRKQISAKYWLGQSSENILSKDFVIENDSFKIALIDANENSIYNEQGVDKISVSHFGDTTVPDKFYEGALLQQSETKFLAGASAFKLDSVSMDGKYIEMRRINPDSVPQRLLVGDQIQEFKFLSTEGDSVSIHDFIEPGKKTFIEFWFIGCTGCMQMIPYIENLHADYPEQIKVLSLNYLQGGEDVSAFIAKRDLHSPYGIVGKKLWKALYGEYAPWSLLLDENGDIETFGIWAMDVQKQIEKEVKHESIK